MMDKSYKFTMFLVFVWLICVMRIGDSMREMSETYKYCSGEQRAFERQCIFEDGNNCYIKSIFIFEDCSDNAKNRDKDTPK
jgi:hypothetical protein